MSISASLQKAIKLQENIERMRGQLAGLLSEIRRELAGTQAADAEAKPRRRGKRGAKKIAGTPRRVGRAMAGASAPVAEEGEVPVRRPKPKASPKGKAAAKGRGRRSLAGRKRASSPSGPLAPAVVKVLESHGEPMRVADILAGLLKNGYAFNAAEPRKNLAARIYRLGGVRQVEPGLFYTA